jgi:sugar lactone lactonase YvrE
MGRTIVRVTPNGQTSVFFRAPDSIANVGLTDALGILKSGFVIVGSVPTLDGTMNTVQQGSLMIIDKNGNLVQNLTDPTLLNGPWGLAVNDGGSRAQLFVANVNSGTITRIDLVIPPGGNPMVESKTQIASGYVHRTDPAAIVIGPSGLAYDAREDILYVASTGDNEIFAIPDAKDRESDAGTGKVVVNDQTHLHGPLGLVLAPNGDLITANNDAVNADPMQPSEVAEFTPGGEFVGQISLNPSIDAGFGIALQFAGPDQQVRFAAVDDNTNTVHVWNIDLDPKSSGNEADTGSEVHEASALTRNAGMAEATSAFFASLNEHQSDSHSQPVDDLMSAHFAPLMSTQPSSPSGTGGVSTAPIFGGHMPHGARLSALDDVFADTGSGL